MVTSLAVGGALLLAMIVASVRGAVTLVADARIPVHCGSLEHCRYVSKRAGLVIWPATGAVLFGVLGGVAGSSLAAGWVPGVRDVLVPAVLCVALAFQVGALAVAGGAGRGREPDQGQQAAGPRDHGTGEQAEEHAPGERGLGQVGEQRAGDAAGPAGRRRQRQPADPGDRAADPGEGRLNGATLRPGGPYHGMCRPAGGRRRPRWYRKAP